MLTLSEESYRVCVCVCQIVCVCVCVREREREIRTLTVKRPRPRLDCCVSERKKLVIKDGEDGHEN
jgi:hypothetical protein